MRSRPTTSARRSPSNIRLKPPGMKKKFAGPVLKCRSNAASFAGWYLATMRAFESPETSAARLAIVAKSKPPVKERRAKSSC